MRTRTTRSALLALCIFSFAEVSAARLTSTSAARLTSTGDHLQKCSPQNLAPRCEDQSHLPLDLRKKTTDADGVVFNYFWTQSREAREKIQEWSMQTSRKQELRALKLAEEMRTNAIKFVSQGQNDSELPLEVRAVIERLRTLKFSIRENASTECFEYEATGIPNAGYSPLEHTIGICPGALKIQSVQFRAMISHELGHVVSPCSLSSPLLHFQPMTEKISSCLLGVGIGKERSEEDIEVFGHQSLMVAQNDSAYVVNHEPKMNEKEISCGAAVVLPGSLVRNPAIYRQFTTCVDARYEKEYADWIAGKSLLLETMPKKPTAIEKTAIDEERLKTPQTCYRKTQEHFADSFGGLIFSDWAKKEKLSAPEFKKGLHDQFSSRCISKINGRSFEQRLYYPPADTRISVFIQSNAAAEVLKCAQPQADFCSLSDDTFSAAIQSTNSSSSPKASTTKPSKTAQ